MVDHIHAVNIDECPSPVIDQNNLIIKRPDQKKRCHEMPLSQRWYKAKQQQISPAQKRALRDYWSKYGIELKYGILISENHTLSELFNNTGGTGDSYMVLDIGFGMGDSIVNMATANPAKKYLGCEIHRAGLATTIQNILKFDLKNIRLIRADISLLLNNHMHNRSINEVCIYFPDPWPNEVRDKERRVVRYQILTALSNVMKPNGILHIATDAELYATHVEECIHNYNSNSSTCYWNLNTKLCSETFQDPPLWRPLTKYAMKANDLGNKVWDFEYQLMLL